MKKIPSLFKRDHEGTRLVYDVVVEGCEWVQDGKGVPTEKIDGTCCLIEGGKLFKRYDAKNGRTPPAGFIPTGDADPVTGHHTGWLPVGEGPEDQWHREAFATIPDRESGTYELIGPKVQGNPYIQVQHSLIRHGSVLLGLDVPTDFHGVRDWLEEQPGIEGVVWHHPDGERSCKVKRRDWGLPWPPKVTP